MRRIIDFAGAKLQEHALCPAYGNLIALSACSSSPSLNEYPSRKNYFPKVDSNTLIGKFMFGYQGWFSVPGDGSREENWFHWTSDRRSPGLNNMAIDLWPDLSEFGQEELFSTPLIFPGGKTAKVFSSYNPKTVQRHFEWMANYNIDGIFLQRFLSEVNDPNLFRFRNEITKNVLKSSKSTGRVFAVMYDLSNARPETLVKDLIKDWKFLVDELHLLNTDRYLQHRSRPLLALWGIGFKNRNISPEQILEIVQWFNDAPEKYRVTLMAGVPTFWRSGIQNSEQDPTWRLDADPK